MGSYPLLKAMMHAFRKSKTSDFFGQKYGGFASKVRRFYAKKSDVSVLPKPTFSISESRGQACLGYAESRQRKTKSRKKAKPNTKAKPTYAFSSHKNIFLLKSPTFPTPGKENLNKAWQSRVKDWV